MCDPQMAAKGSLAGQGFGAGLSTVGAFFSAKQQQDQYRHQARLAEINAKIAESNARAATERGIFEEERIKLRGSQQKSRQKARYAGSGVDVAGSNSALASITGTDVITEADANQARANAVRAAWGQRIEAGNLRRAASSLEASAKGISPGLATASSLISGATRVASSWYSLNKEGAFDAPVEQRTGTATVAPGYAPNPHANTLQAPIDPRYAKLGGRDPFSPPPISFSEGEDQLLLWGW